MKNGFNTKNLIIIILVIIVLSIAGFALSSVLKGDNSGEPENNGGEIKPVSYAITSIYQLELTSDAKTVDVGGTSVSLALIDGKIVVNDNEISDITANYAYVTDQVVIFGNNTKCGTIITYVVDKSGNSVLFDTNDYKLIDFRMYENKCVARNVGVCTCKEQYDYCDESYDIVISYDGTQISISELT